MHKRLLGVYCLFLVLVSLSIFRVYQLTTSSDSVMSYGTQSRYALKISQSRGVVYDRNMQKLVNENYKYIASVLPGPQSLDAMLKNTPEEQHADIINKYQNAIPFSMLVQDQNIYASGIDVFRVPERYSQKQLAPHLIGYMGAGGEYGAAGIEKAFDDILNKYSTSIETHYSIDAIGHIMSGDGTYVKRTGEEVPFGGVVTTLDKNIQIVTQQALENGCEKGAAVVLDIYSGDILAMASIPSFDPNNIAASLESTDAPFINRAVSGYNIGSAFKVYMAAAALESGLTRNYSYTCQGYIDIGGQIFKCNNNAVHGEINMDRALQVSCNTYFVNLGMQIDPKYTLSMLSNLGFASSSQLAPGIETQTGNMPDVSEFINPAALANFSFGQGTSLATPLQMACAVASIANGGNSVVPRLIIGTTPDGAAITDVTKTYSSNRILSEKTAQTVKDLMIGVIENGSGRTAKPIRGGAGGKTSSAQTGIMKDGVEEVHAWFTGFYPAEKPRYSIVVFVEGGVSGENVAGPIFKSIADGII